jgi:hypothetical protein
MFCLREPVEGDEDWKQIATAKNNDAGLLIHRTTDEKLVPIWGCDDLKKLIVRKQTKIFVARDDGAK